MPQLELIQSRPTWTRPGRALRAGVLCASMVACAVASAQERRPEATGGRPVPAAEDVTTIDAENVEGASEFEVTARGRVELRRGDTTVFSESLKYNRELGLVEAEGGVRLERGGDRIFGPRLRYNLNNDTGEFIAPSYMFQREGQTAHGKAERVEFRGKDRYLMHTASFTTCRPSQDEWVMWSPPADASEQEGYAWMFRAAELDLDYDAKEGRATSPRLRFFETPIAALPYITFPLESRRKSGFLAPRYAHTTSSGVSIGVPYYANIMPEMDATLTPVHMVKRGEQLKSEVRYLGRSYSGEVSYDILPRDRLMQASREMSGLSHRQQFAPGLSGGLDVRRVSDYRYFADFSTQAQDVSIVNVPQDAFLNYGGTLTGWGGYGVSLRAQRFQNLQDPLATPATPPYHRLPQVNFSTGRNNIAGVADLAVPAEYVRFVHPTLVDGRRVAFNPTLATPFLTPGWQVTPRVGVRYVTYTLGQTAPGQPTFPSASIPWASLDTGLAFERDASGFGDGFVQTLEPRLYYVYVPYRDQSALPLFDTGLNDLNFASIFTENRFSGNDRFGDARQATLAATSRLLGPGGRETFRALIGQRYYFQNERVGLTPDAPLRTRATSDLLTSFGGRHASGFVYDFTAQYNTQDRYTQRYTTALRYAPQPAKVVNLSYRYNVNTLRQPDLRQVDLTGQWPMGAGWYAVGRYNYSLLDQRMLEGLAGIEYNGGCWVFRGVVQQIQTTVQFVSTGIYLQLEFNGFGQLGGEDTVTLLKRTVPGYMVTNPSDPALVPPAQQRRLPFEQVY